MRNRPAIRVYTPHCFYPASTPLGHIKRFAYDPTLERAALAASTRVIALSRRGVEDGVALGGARERFRIVPNAVDFASNMHALSTAAEPPEAYPDAYLLFTGRVDANKHVDFLVDAAPALSAMGLTVVVIGPDGGELERVQARARTLAVTDLGSFRGRVSHSELVWAIAHAALVALPSRYEGLPTTLIEAAALGVPVVGTQQGGTPDLLSELASGFSFPLDDQAVFVEAVSRALRSSAEERKATAEYVRKRYSWSTVVDEILDVYVEASE